MSITNIISAIGNNNSIYPLLVRDCGIEVPSKIYLTYNQNVKESKEVAKLATRERFIDEYSVSAIWLGGIPLVGKISDMIIRKNGYNPDVNLKLFKKDDAQGIDLNIEKFTGKVSEEIINDLKKVRDNKKTYEKLLSAKFIASTAIPIALMGFVLPKLIFASSAKKIAAQRAIEVEKRKSEKINNKAQNNSYKTNFTSENKDVFTKMSLDKKNTPSFKGGWASTVANYSTVQKMAVTDGGYSVGRVATARNKNEAMDVGFKMSGMLFLNFVAPKYIAKALDAFTGKTFKLDVALDPKMLNDTEFINAIKNKKIKLPKSNDAQELLDFVDNNPKSLFVQYAQKFGKIKMLKNGVRDPRAYVNIKNLGEFSYNIETFAKKALSSKDILKFAKKAKAAKTFNIVTNVALSSFLLAYCLPKVQFAFRKLVTGSDLEPGLANAEQLEKQ